MKGPGVGAIESKFERRRKLSRAALLLVLGALFTAGCTRTINTSNRGNAGGGGNTANAGNSNGAGQPPGKSPEEIKGMADTQGQATAPDKGNFKVVFAEPQGEKFGQIYDELKSSDSIERMADELNATLALPEDVTVSFKECGKVAASWDAKARAINVCYELISDSVEKLKTIAKDDRELEDAAGAATAFVFVHELGHCLMDLLKLPRQGAEEEAVDQLAAYALIEGEGDEGKKMALSGAKWWGRKYDELVKSGASDPHLNQAWADEHSFTSQRFYNIICWVYGRDPRKFQSVANNPLPEARATRCPEEYERLSGTWMPPLKPYLKGGGKS